MNQKTSSESPPIPPDPFTLVYAITVDDDLGYDGVEVDSAFLHKEDAERVVRQIEDRISGTVELTTVRLYPSFDAWAQVNSISLKESALAKLTPAEKRALGLTDN